MTIIHYDKPVEDLIRQLSATGHVTHSKHKKKSVTFHHNAGKNLSHEEVLHIWTSRPASAHFDVDMHGLIAQYVEADEYAWAVGNTVGNEETISIELTNSTDGPKWEVADVTWEEGARLAGWLFAYVIEEAPSKSNVFPHHHWSSTSCPGPYLDSIFDKIVAAVQASYEYFTQHHPTPAPVPTVAQLQQQLKVDVDGKWGKVTDARALLLRAAARTHAGWPHNSPQHFDIREVQRVIGTKADGIWGRQSQAALVLWIHRVQHILEVVVDGDWGPATDHAYLVLRKKSLNNF